MGASKEASSAQQKETPYEQHRRSQRELADHRDGCLNCQQGQPCQEREILFSLLRSATQRVFAP